MGLTSTAMGDLAGISGAVSCFACLRNFISRCCVVLQPLFLLLMRNTLQLPAGAKRGICLTITQCTQAVLADWSFAATFAVSVASAVLAPAVEELIYRGFLLRSLTRYMSTPVAVRPRPCEVVDCSPTKPHAGHKHLVRK